MCTCMLHAQHVHLHVARMTLAPACSMHGVWTCMRRVDMRCMSTLHAACTACAAAYGMESMPLHTACMVCAATCGMHNMCTCMWHAWRVHPQHAGAYRTPGCSMHERCMRTCVQRAMHVHMHEACEACSLHTCMQHANHVHVYAARESCAPACRNR